jgi:uncharacterized protein
LRTALPAEGTCRRYIAQPDPLSLAWTAPGFPPLNAAVSARRPDRNEILKLLLEDGADTAQPGINGGINGWAPLHFAVAKSNLETVKLPLAHGPDPEMKTRIDQCTSDFEDAEAAGFTRAVALMREAYSKTIPAARTT